MNSGIVIFKGTALFSSPFNFFWYSDNSIYSKLLLNKYDSEYASNMYFSKILYFISRLYKCFVLGLHPFLIFIYNIVCKIVAAVTVEKVIILKNTEDPKKNLYINEDNLEKRFGGEAFDLDYGEDNSLFPPRMPSDNFFLENENPKDILISEEDYIQKYNSGQIPQSFANPYLAGKLKKVKKVIKEEKEKEEIKEEIKEENEIKEEKEVKEVKEEKNEIKEEKEVKEEKNEIKEEKDVKAEKEKTEEKKDEKEKTEEKEKAEENKEKTEEKDKTETQEKIEN